MYIINDWVYCWSEEKIQRVKMDGSQLEVIFETNSETEDLSENKEPTEKIELNNTYETRFGEVNMITYPKFAFDFPSSWDITEDVTPNGETVTLTNDRGATVTYMHLAGVPVGPDAIGGSSVYMARVEASKAADSSFEPSYVQATDHSDLGKFVVAKLKQTGEMDMAADSEFTDIDGETAYAVLPELQLGVNESVRNPYCIDFGFNYSGGISFIASAPEGGFTEQDEKLVIEILKSFRVSE